jgi:hypothetical protein
MRCGLLGALVLVASGCLAAPERGADGDTGGPGDGDDPGGADRPDAVAGFTCPDQVEVAYVSSFEAPIGQSNIRLPGIAVFVNVGDGAVDLSNVIVESTEVSDMTVGVAVQISPSSDLIEPGSAYGLVMVQFQDVILSRVPEPWVPEAPGVELSLSHDIEREAYVVHLVLRAGELVFPLEIEVIGDGDGEIGEPFPPEPWRALAGARVAGICDA